MKLQVIAQPQSQLLPAGRQTNFGAAKLIYFFTIIPATLNKIFIFPLKSEAEQICTIFFFLPVFGAYIKFIFQIIITFFMNVLQAYQAERQINGQEHPCNIQLPNPFVFQSQGSLIHKKSYPFLQQDSFCSRFKYLPQ